MHFLVDYYALLGLKRFESDREKIQQAYSAFRSRQPKRKRQSKKTAPSEAEAEQHWRAGSEAYSTLSDSDKKRAYDAKLANWQGPVSDDGTPVIRVTDPLWQVPVLTSEQASPSTSDELQQSTARLQSRDDPGLLEHLRRGRLLSGQAAILYFMAATRHLEYWLCRIELRRHADGITAPIVIRRGDIRPQLAAIHEKEALRAETTWQELEDGISQGAIRALPAGDTTLKMQRAQAVRARDETTAAVLAFAEQYDAMQAELAAPLYAPPQDQMHPNVVVVLYVADQVIRFAYRLDSDGTARPTEDLDEQKLDALDAPEEAARLISSGWNIIYAFHPHGSEPAMFIESVVRAHYAKMEANTE